MSCRALNPGVLFFCQCEILFLIDLSNVSFVNMPEYCSDSEDQKKKKDFKKEKEKKKSKSKKKIKSRSRSRDKKHKQDNSHKSSKNYKH
mgnify:CR=1 FL=1